MIEQWKPVVGYETLYEVSTEGRVRSLTRTVPHARFGTATYQGKLLKQGLGKHGYYVVVLSTESRTKCCNVHILVLTTYKGPAPKGAEACHGPLGSQINSVENLRWGSRQENADDRDLRDKNSRNQHGPWTRKK